MLLCCAQLLAAARAAAQELGGAVVRRGDAGALGGRGQRPHEALWGTGKRTHARTAAAAALHAIIAMHAGRPCRAVPCSAMRLRAPGLCSAMDYCGLERDVSSIGDMVPPMAHAGWRTTNQHAALHGVRRPPAAVHVFTSLPWHLPPARGQPCNILHGPCPACTCTCTCAQVDASLTWSFIPWLRSITRLPILIKVRQRVRA